MAVTRARRLTGILAAASFAGCTAVLALDLDYHIEGASGGETASSTSSTSATGGASSSGGSSVSGAGSTTGSGGHEGGTGTTGSGGNHGGTGTTTHEGPKCLGLEPSCGDHESCCAQLSVPGGTYDRGYDGSTYADSSHPATVSGFSLDRFEVTVGRFRAFVDGFPADRPSPGAGAHPLIASSGWRPAWDSSLPADQATLRAALHCDTGDSTWTDAPGLGENKPMNCMTWYEAFAFCVWDGGRLPTEAEWNYAAAGGSEQRPYPWGTGVDPSHAVYDCTGDGSAAQDCQSSDILDVGSRSPRGDGKWGHADLAGSMWEWTLDADTTGAYPDPCVDCADVTTTSLRVYRGGGWFSPADNVLVSRRSSIDPSTRVNRIGVRCARGP